MPLPGRTLSAQLVWPVVGLVLIAVLANVAFAAWLATRSAVVAARTSRERIVAALDRSRIALVPAVLDALGDLTGKQAGVISTPHACVYALTPGDRALLLASDGVWDFVGNAEAASVVLSTEDCCDAASRLARLARARWLIHTGGGDDTTAAATAEGGAEATSCGCR